MATGKICAMGMFKPGFKLHFAFGDDVLCSRMTHTHNPGTVSGLAAK